MSVYRTPEEILCAMESACFFTDVEIIIRYAAKEWAPAIASFTYAVFTEAG